MHQGPFVLLMGSRAKGISSCLTVGFKFDPESLSLGFLIGENVA